MTKISVILTCYNAEKTVEEVVDSILKQEGIETDFKIELIAVDDCSTDETYSILESIPGIQCFKTERNSGGPNAGRNIGLSKCTGDYICLADHDDIWFPNRISTLLPYLNKTPIVTSGYSLVDSATGYKEIRACGGNQKFRHFEKNRTFFEILKKQNGRQNTYLGSIMFHRDLKNIRFEEVFGVVDYDWILKIFEGNESIEVCEPLYTRHVDGMNLSLNEEYRSKDFHYSLMCLEKYFDVYPGEVKIAMKKIYGSRARFYYLIGNMEKARFYFSRSGISLKMIGYYLTTYWGSEFVKKKFNVFG